MIRGNEFLCCCSSSTTSSWATIPSLAKDTLLIPPKSHYDCVTEFEHKAAAAECATTTRAMKAIANAIVSAIIIPMLSEMIKDEYNLDNHLKRRVKSL